MATTTKKKSTQMAFIDVGKIEVTNADNQKETVQEYAVIAEDLAKYIGATYTLKSPPPISFTRKGKTITREVSTKPSGRPYKIGYINGVTKKGKKSSIRYKWVTIHVPPGAKLRVYLAALFKKVSKKPAYLRTPGGVTTRLFDTK